ncbi:MAG: hypothetical protein LBO69_02370 [Ignavibacteria bacterium]|nr:hypothetical protein [Ignavibacteria bacterium]
MNEQVLTQIELPMPQLDELPLDLQYVASVMDVDTAWMLMQNFTSTSIYVPKITEMPAYIKRVLMAYPEVSLKEMAAVLHCSELYLKRLKWEMVV